jgi:hypothetical protein
MTLIDRVLKQVAQDVANRDYTAIEELLQYVPEHVLEGFVSECFQDEDGQPSEHDEWMSFDPDC